MFDHKMWCWEAGAPALVEWKIVKGGIVHLSSMPGLPVEAATVEVRMRWMHRVSLAGIMGKVERVDSRRASRAGKEDSRCPPT